MNKLFAQMEVILVPFLLIFMAILYLVLWRSLWVVVWVFRFQLSKSKYRQLPRHPFSMPLLTELTNPEGNLEGMLQKMKTADGKDYEKIVNWGPYIEGKIQFIFTIFLQFCSNKNNFSSMGSIFYN